MDVEFQQYKWDANGLRGQSLESERQLINELFFEFDTPENPSAPWTTTNKSNSPKRDAKKSDTLKEPTTRTRRVTITEITEEEGGGDWTLVDSSSDEEDAGDGMATDEVFQLLDDAVQDWKIKLECIIGEGLKKLRKSSKEKRLMMKYLPGDGALKTMRLHPAKAEILRDWKIDFDQTVSGIQSKLGKLADGKLQDMDALYKSKLLPNYGVKCQDPNKHKKEVISIDCREEGRAKPDCAFTGLKTLIKELDRMCNTIANTKSGLADHCIPIYNMYNTQHQTTPHVIATPYEFPWKKYLQQLGESQIEKPFMQSEISPEVYKAFAKHQASVLNALDDVRMKQMKSATAAPQALKTFKTKSKEVRRDTNAMMANRKMLARKAQRTAKQEKEEYSYRLREFRKNGEDHFLVVRKRIVKDTDQEDIFEDWRINILDKKVANRTRAPRVRKLSHRASRKEMLKEEQQSPKHEGPLLYADVVKKNLKYRPSNIPVEDIFEAWRDYLLELDDVLSNDFVTDQQCIKRAKEEKEFQLAETASETLGCSQPEMQVCGKPTVQTLAPKKNKMALRSFAVAVTDCDEKASLRRREILDLGLRDKRLGKKQRKFFKYQSEIIFAGWRHNLIEDPSFYASARGSKRLQRARKYEMEEYFREFRKNFHTKEEYLNDRKPRQRQPTMMPEKIFNDWLHNFHIKKYRHHNHYNEMKRRHSKKARDNPAEDKDQTAGAAPEFGADALKNRPRGSSHRRSSKKRKGNMKFEK